MSFKSLVHNLHTHQRCSTKQECWVISVEDNVIRAAKTLQDVKLKWLGFYCKWDHIFNLYIV